MITEIKPDRLKAHDIAVDYINDIAKTVGQTNDIVGIAVVTIYKDGYTGTGWSGGKDSYSKFTMVGGIECLKHRFIKAEVDF